MDLVQMIRRIRLKNFKSYSDEQVELSMFTILLGANGTGKSNLFDALRLLKSIGEKRSVRDALQGHSVPGGGIAAVSGIRGGAQSLKHFGCDDDDVEISVTIDTGDDLLEYTVAINPERFQVVREQLTSKRHPGPYVFSTFPETTPLTQDAEGIVLKARFYKRGKGPNPSRDFSPHEFVLSQFEQRKAESRINEEIAAIVRSELSAITPLELRPETLRQYSTLGQFEMGEHGENFAGAVYELETMAMHGITLRSPQRQDPQEVRTEASRRMRSILSWLSEVTPRPISELTIEHAPTGESIVAMREEPYEQLVAAPSLSDGTLRFAALALSAMGSDRHRTLCIEEIENGINPSRVALLVRMMEEISAADEANQVIASTHSPAVLNSARDETLETCIVVGWDEEERHSVASRLMDLPGLERIRQEGISIGDLQEEGWINEAASV